MRASSVNEFLGLSLRFATNLALQEIPVKILVLTSCLIRSSLARFEIQKFEISLFSIIFKFSILTKKEFIIYEMFMYTFLLWLYDNV